MKISNFKFQISNCLQTQILPAKTKFLQEGSLLLEVLFAGVVLGTIFLTSATAIGVAFNSIASGNLQNNANFLLQEELEPLLTVRDKGWVANIVDGTYYVKPQANSWQLVATTSGETVGEFSRNVVISDVYRDSNGQIVTTGGTLDQSTKKAVATVSWESFGAHSLLASTYITRYKDNLQWIQTNKADFDLGTKTGIATQFSGGSPTDGEVILGSGGGHGGDWCAPNLTLIPPVDLPKNGVANAITAIAGQAFAGTGDNSSGVSFANVTIDQIGYPPAASVAGTFDGYKTNSVFGETNYAYLGTDNNAKEVVIIDLTQQVSGKYVEAGYFNAPGNGNGNSVYVSGTTGYMTDGSKLYNFDLSSKSGSRSIIDADGVTLDGTGNKVVVVGNYAYVAINATSNQLDIVDISNPTNLTVVGKATVAGRGATDIFVNSSATRAYLVTSGSSSQKEFFIIDITTKTGNSHTTVGSFDTNGMSPKGVTVVTLNKAIVVGTGGYEYQVLDIANESNPTLCGPNAQLNIDTGVNGVAGVIEPDGDVYSYIITGDSSSEFKIIEGGGGGHNYSALGTFQSSTGPIPTPAQSTALNRFTATFAKPSQTDLQFQVAGADVGNDGTCNSANFTYVGPDATAATYFTTSSSPLTAAIPLSSGPGYKNPAACFRYRAYFTSSDATQTPVLYDFTVNYSP